MKELIQYGQTLEFGDGHEINRITNLPPGATAEVSQSNQEFLSAEVKFPCGKKESWYLGKGDREGDYWLAILSHVELGPFNPLLGMLALIWLFPLKALCWMLRPLKWPYNLLANDWREYRKELDNKIRK